MRLSCFSLAKARSRKEICLDTFAALHLVYFQRFNILANLISSKVAMAQSKKLSNTITLWQYATTRYSPLFQKALNLFLLHKIYVSHLRGLFQYTRRCRNELPLLYRTLQNRLQ